MSKGRTWAAVITAVVFLVAACLRAPITSVGPVIERIGAELSIGPSQLGLLGALPVLGFAAMSPLVAGISRRMGAERLLFYALVLLAAGIVARSWLGLPGLWLGTVVVGCMIAIGNVLVPVLVKRDYRNHVPLATGAFSAIMGTSAAVASASSAPLAEAGSWRTSIGIWVLLVGAVAVVWAVRLRHTEGFFGPLPGTNAGGRIAGAKNPATQPAAGLGHGGGASGAAEQPAEAKPTSILKQPTAWLLTAYMGVQSSAFYILVNWLPSIEVTHGMTELRAGFDLFVFQIIGVVAGLAVPFLMRNPNSQTAAIVVSALPLTCAGVGLLMFPQALHLWVVLMAISAGATIVIALALIGMRGSSHEETTKLSGMAQSLGYLLAACGPFIAGALRDVTGGWDATLILISAIGVGQIVLGLFLGKPPTRQTVR